MIRPFRALVLKTALLSGLLSVTGCAAFRPIEGIPARYVPDEIKSASRSGKKTIDLSLLSQTQPEVYRLDAGDVLAVYIEGVIPRPNELPPVNLPQQGEEAAPALGYPIPVRQDGTISLPLLSQALPLRGLTVKQAEEAIRRAYTVDKRILQAGNERVWVILHKPRQYRVLVIRQEGTENPTVGLNGAINLGALKRGTGRAVTLSAYKNDVLHALAETGGLPGLDAENTIYVLRNKRRPVTTPQVGGQGMPPHAGWSVTSPQAPVMNGWPSTLPGGHSLTMPGATSGLVPHTNSIPGSNVIPQPPSDQALPPNASEIPMPSPQEPSGSPLAPQTWNHWGTSTSGIQPTAWSSEGPITTHSTAVPTMPNPGNGSVIPLIPMPSQFSGHDFNLPPTHSPGHWPEVSAESWMGHSTPGDPTLANHAVIKIPVRLATGEAIQFTERDIILEDGDIVFIESRETEIFYTGGLLGGGQYTLPRDYDLDVLGAIAVAQAGRQQNGAANRGTGGVSALNNDVTISASQAVILRKMPNGTQVPIKVDLYRALRHPEERVLIQPGDYLMLQYSPMEACGAFFERHLLEGALFGVAASQFNSGR